MKRLMVFGTACVIVCAILGINLIAINARAQQQPNQQALSIRQIQQTMQSAPFSNPFASQSQAPNQQQPLQQPQPQQQFPNQQQPLQQPQPQQQYPPQLQNQFRQPQMQSQLQPQQGQGMGILMNESQVISCLHRVLSDSIVKAHSTKQNETTFINNATSTLDSCILPKR